MRRRPGPRVGQRDECVGHRVCHNEVMHAPQRASVGLLFVALAATVGLSQPVPQPFPQPNAPQPARPGATKPSPPAVPPSQPAQPARTEPSVPDEAFLGVPIYPTARFVGSYDAGRGQRYYLFGVTLGFADIVTYYRTALKNRGELVYQEPPVHMFETGRFREQTMAFPPSVTVKDYTWGGSQGYLVPLAGGKSERYPTIIQIVPVPPGERR
jgi:hypothetical protein